MNHKQHDRLKIALCLGAISLVAVSAYFSVFSNDFVRWDDDRYITGNQHIKDVTVKKAVGFFTTYFHGHYHPLTLLSLSIDYGLGKGGTTWFHVHALILHIFNALLVFWFVYLLWKAIANTGDSRGSLIVPLATSLLFVLHPIQVESVAWMSERKNLLFAFYFLLSLIVYLKYIEREKGCYYILALVLFVLSVLSKATAITLVASLVLIDYGCRRKMVARRMVAEKLPFLLVAVVGGIVAQAAQRRAWGTSGHALLQYSVSERVFFAANAFVQYLIKLIIPYNLSAYYPYPDLAGGMPPVYWFTLIATFIVGICALLLVRRNNLLFFGLAFFIVNIILLLKLLSVPTGNYFMADRYAYVPAIGIFLILGWVFHQAWQKAGRFRAVIAFIAVIYVAAMGVFTNNRVKVWNSSLSLFTDILKKYPCPLIWNNRGSAKEENNDIKGAIADYSQAIAMKPDYVEAYINRGRVKVTIGDVKSAIADFNKALLLRPDAFLAYYNRGVANARMLNWRDAIADFKNALKISPDSAAAKKGRLMAEEMLGGATSENDN